MTDREEHMIRVWRFDDAPLEYQAMSPHGGDEEWLAVLPTSYNGGEPTFMFEGTSFGCCSVSKHPLPDGRTVVIGAHA